MHAGMPKQLIPNTTNCGRGVLWFVQNENSNGFYFKSGAGKARMIRAYPAIKQLHPVLTKEEIAYVPASGDYIYFRWQNAASHTNVSHVGIVRTVEAETLTTFEGNSGRKVATRSFSLMDTQILGYGKPAYRLIHE